MYNKRIHVCCITSLIIDAKYTNYAVFAIQCAYTIIHESASQKKCQQDDDSQKRQPHFCNNITNHGCYSAVDSVLFPEWVLGIGPEEVAILLSVVN
jgi:hypothetical protein